METPRFSVAMCTFNGERYLREQLDSMAAQTVLPDELVVCDDGSTDATVDILENFARMAPFKMRIRVNERNLGVARNFFQAIRSCSHEWVLLSDQDDVWLPDRVGLFSEAIAVNPEARLVQSDANIKGPDMATGRKTLFQSFHLNRQEIRALNNGRGIHVLARHLFCTGAGMAVKRAFVQTLPEPAGQFLHDEWISWFALPHIHVISRPTFNYRQHGGQLTGIDGRLIGRIRRLFKPEAKSIMTVQAGVRHYTLLIAHLRQWSEAETAATVSMLKKKIGFLERRERLPVSPVKRLVRIVTDIGVADYWKYGSGYRTLLKDMLGKDRL